ncbi:MAG: 3-phosphoshikimate 1-carboxyvinyltransferase, partial [Oscillospiraceae bacterium]|nr:3-phosphoshikimate 1-carboxyvinyltransferase [Oscillospiraceae bacterium]
MDITVYPRLLNGAIQSIPSKSQAHRLLICGALSDAPFHLYCPSVNDDIEATADCLNAMGAHIVTTEGGYWVEPIGHLPQKASLYCRESGSTLRFLLPVVAALGIEATFFMEGRLPERPLSPLREELQKMGAVLSRPSKNTILCTGKLRSGHYT